MNIRFLPVFSQALALPFQDSPTNPPSSTPPPSPPQPEPIAPPKPIEEEEEVKPKSPKNLWILDLQEGINWSNRTVRVDTQLGENGDLFLSLSEEFLKNPVIRVHTKTGQVLLKDESEKGNRSLWGIWRKNQQGPLELLVFQLDETGSRAKISNRFVFDPKGNRLVKENSFGPNNRGISLEKQFYPNAVIDGDFLYALDIEFTGDKTTSGWNKKYKYQITCTNIHTGEISWTFISDEFNRSRADSLPRQLFLNGDLFFIASSDQNHFAYQLNAQTGEVIQRGELNDLTIPWHPVVTKERANGEGFDSQFFPNGDWLEDVLAQGTYVARKMNSRENKIQWQVPMGNGFRTFVDSKGDVFAHVNQEGKTSQIKKLRGVDGEEVWSQSLVSPSQVILTSAGNVFVAHWRGDNLIFSILDSLNGNELFQYDFSEKRNLTPINPLIRTPSGEILVFVAGKLYAFSTLNF